VDVRREAQLLEVDPEGEQLLRVQALVRPVGGHRVVERAERLRPRGSLERLPDPRAELGLASVERVEGCFEGLDLVGAASTRREPSTQQGAAGALKGGSPTTRGRW
jgi:hypothetical protein